MAFIPRMLLLLCTEWDRHPSEEEHGSLYLKTELYPRTGSQHANTNVLWQAICFSSRFLHYKQLEEVVKISMLLYIVHHSTWYPFLEGMINSSRKYRVRHSVICQLILNIQFSINIAYTDNSALLLLLFFCSAWNQCNFKYSTCQNRCILLIRH